MAARRDDRLGPLEHITPATIATDRTLLEDITGVLFEAPKPLESNIITFKVDSAFITDNLLRVTLSADSTTIKSAKWRARKVEVLRQIVERFQTDSVKLPQSFNPVEARKSPRLSVRDNNAQIFTRCAQWTSGCSTECSARLTLSDLAGRHRARVVFEFSFFKCHEHYGSGKVSGQVRGANLECLLSSSGRISDPPRVAQIKAHTASDYNPHSAVRKVPTAAAMRQLKSNKNRVGARGKDWFETLLEVQERDCAQSQYLNVPDVYRGSIRTLQRGVVKVVAVYSIKR